jgi:hypothetical protein
MTQGSLESDETNNCRPATTVQVGRPDLVTTKGSLPVAVVRKLPMTDTVRIAFSRRASHVKYYLSLDAIKSPTDKL